MRWARNLVRQPLRHHFLWTGQPVCAPRLWPQLPICAPLALSEIPQLCAGLMSLHPALAKAREVLDGMSKQARACSMMAEGSIAQGVPKSARSGGHASGGVPNVWHDAWDAR